MKKSILRGASVVAILSFAFAFSGCGNNKSAEKPPEKPPVVQEKHIYDNAKVVDMQNGLGTAVIGKVSITKANSSDVTDDTLEDWYFNYAKKNIGQGEKWNYALIVYTDNEKLGVLCNAGGLTKNVPLTKDKYGETYSASTSSSSQEYFEDPSNPGHLKKYVIK